MAEQAPINREGLGQGAPGRRIKLWTALVAQLATPSILAAYTRYQTAAEALPIALAGLAVASLLALWVGAVWHAAPAILRWVYGICSVAGGAVCLGLMALHPFESPGYAFVLNLLALVAIQGPLAFALLGSPPESEDEVAPTVAAARLVFPIWLTAAQIAMVVATALFVVPVNGREAAIFFSVALGVFAVLPIVGVLLAKVEGEATVAFCDNPTQFGIISAAMTLFSVLAGLSALAAEPIDGDPEKLAILLAALVFAAALAVVFCWRQAIEDQRFPVPDNKAAKFDHIDTWGVVLFTLAVGGIVLIALWAATSQATTDGINANWGLGTTAVVAAMFIAFAFAPQIELHPAVSAGLKNLSETLKPIGDFFSWVDGVMAIPIACAQGANLDHTWQRYLILALAIVPCGVLGYWLPAPFGLLAIGWGFIITIAISRRWAWVEDDRELAMLTRNFSSASLRVGFKQDLRDEALLSFMSMFIFVPLALRQADMWAVQIGAELFTLREGTPNDLQTWMAFYGSELAKAVPFVDWAETYSVEGQTNVEFKDSIWAKHLVFMTRILVDLVFLGALLQAIAISGRIAKQREMFFGKDRAKNEYRHGSGRSGQLNMLDPFIESKEFKKLRSADGGVDPKKVESFPTYDQARLVALTSDPDEAIAKVARALRNHQRTDDPEVLKDLYATLDEIVYPKEGRFDKDRVKEVVAAIKEADGSPDIVSLRSARGELNNKPWATYVRKDLVQMIADADTNIADNPEVAKQERREALVWCLVGDQSGELAENPEERVRDAHRDVREVALNALIEMAPDPLALNAINRCAQTDPAGALKQRAKRFLAEDGGA
jgi:hypothetical protein